MKISLQWLCSLLDLDLEIEALSDALTSIGLEVEKLIPIETVEGGLHGVVVGEVVECIPHPNADRLKLTRVDVGQTELLHIVCGAPNVENGQKVLVALVGAKLFPIDSEPFVIKKSKIRGEASEGMICAEDELGLGKSHDGILILDPSLKPGTPAAKALKLESDIVFEIGLTPNRADAMGHYGVARDLYAWAVHRGFDAQLKMPEVSGFELLPKSEDADSISLQVIDRQACPHYRGVSVRLKTAVDTPDWMRKRIESIGLKPISFLVDAANYTMHECGHPLHVFDRKAIVGDRIEVRGCGESTPFTGLDGKVRNLSESDLAICNSEGPMALAGIFGGLESGVSAETLDFFVESAWFDPVRIRKSARRHAMNTDASFRYERGVDPALADYALKRLVVLISQYAEVELRSEVLVSGAPIELNRAFEIDSKRMLRGIGLELSEKALEKILNSLEILKISSRGEKWLIQVPGYRVDVRREADVAEEVLRIYGLNEVPFPEKLSFNTGTGDRFPRWELKKKASLMLAGMGFSEIMNNSLHRSAAYPEAENERRIEIANPLSTELDVLRTDLDQGAWEAIRRNLNHRTDNLRLFEFGKIYESIGRKTRETESLGMWIYGRREPENWRNRSEAADVFELKSQAEQLLARLLAKPLESKMSEGRLLWTTNGTIVGSLRSISAQECKKHQIERGAAVWIDWGMLCTVLEGETRTAVEPPRFPAVRRDLALLSERTVSFSDIERAIRRIEPKITREIGLFDVYEGEKIPSNKQSIAVSISFRDDSATLTDERVERAIAKILELLQKELSVELRAAQSA